MQDHGVPEAQQTTLLEACGLVEGFNHSANSDLQFTHLCLKEFWQAWKDGPEPRNKV